MTTDYEPLDTLALALRLNRLLDLLLSPGDPSEAPAQTRLGTRVTRKRKARYVSFSAEEVRLYRSVLRDVSRLREAEWQDERQRDLLLWALASEAAYHPTRFIDPAFRQARLDKLLAGLLRPLQQYTVALTVLHMTPPTFPIALWESTLLPMTDNQFQHHIARDRSGPFWRDTVDPASTAVLVMTEFGTAVQGAVERARNRASGQLHMLRAVLALDIVTHAAQLRFTLGEHAFVVQEGVEDAFWAGWRRKREPVTLTITEASRGQLRTLASQFERLQLCHATVRTAVELAYQWLGRGLERDSDSDALRDFTTALEILLIARDNTTRRGNLPKGTILPYRMIALADLNHSAMPHPATIYYAYVRRSDLVHEGTLDAMEAEAKHMRRAASECLEWLVAFATSHPSATHNELLVSLDTPSGRRLAIAWLSAFKDPWSDRLAAGVSNLPLASA